MSKHRSSVRLFFVNFMNYKTILDENNSLDLISSSFQRFDLNVFFSSGFIDFVIFPTFSTLLHLFSQVSAPSIASLNAAKVNANFPGEHTPVSGDILKSRFGDVELK